MRGPEVLPAPTASAHGDLQVSSITGETFELKKKIMVNCGCVVMCQDTAVVPHSGVKTHLKRKGKTREGRKEGTCKEENKEERKKKRERGQERESNMERASERWSYDFRGRVRRSLKHADRQITPVTRRTRTEMAVAGIESGRVVHTRRRFSHIWLA